MTKSKIAHKLYLIDSFPFRGISLEKGDGVYLYDKKGNKYLDLISNYGVNIFGYNHPVITKKLQEQIETLSNLHGSFANETRGEAARKLIKRCRGSRKVYFSNSGAEAIEAAIKFAVYVKGKTKIIAAKGSYHGKTLGALSVTHSEKYRPGKVKEILLDVHFVSFGKLDKIKKETDEETAAVILEPIQGESGIIMPPEGYLKEVERVCKEKGVLLVLDEIQTGVGRTGSFLFSENEGVDADIICLGKGLAGGIPVGATLVKKEIADEIPKLLQTSTFGGNPLVSYGVLATLSLLDGKQLEKVSEMGDYFIDELRKIESKRIKKVKGAGLMIGVEVKQGRDQILKDLQEKGILAGPAGENVVRFLPPYLITKDQIDSAVSVLKEIL